MHNEVTDSPERNVHTPVVKQLRIIDFVGFLVGNRESIERVLTCPQALYFGALLVATVALVREYDTTVLWHNPSELAKPFIASITLCFIIYSAYRIFLALMFRTCDTGTFWLAFPKFLTGYWWTAPIAWLYAVPVEILTDEISAVRLNLWALSVVSIWRVLLFSRVASIHFGIPFWGSLLWILPPCILAAFLGSAATTLNVVGVMGGIQLTASQELVVSYSSFVGKFSFYAFIPSLVIAVIASILLRGKTQQSNPLEDRSTSFSKSMWTLPIAAFLALGAGCCYFQPRLLNEERVDRLIRSDSIEQAIQLMETTGRDNFRPNWKPLTVHQFELQTHREQVITALEKVQPEAWVSDLMLKSVDTPRTPPTPDVR